MAAKSTTELAKAPLKDRWTNTEQIQGKFLQMYFCPATEKEFLATKVSNLDWMDYVVSSEGKEYRGCLVTVTEAVSKVLESPEFVSDKKEFLSISNKYIAEIERLKAALAKAEKATVTTEPKTKKASAPKAGDDGFPRFPGKPGKLNSNTPESKAARQEWRAKIAETGGVEAPEFTEWAKAFMGSPKSVDALEKADQFTKWNSAVVACAEYDSKH